MPDMKRILQGFMETQALKPERDISKYKLCNYFVISSVNGFPPSFALSVVIFFVSNVGSERGFRCILVTHFVKHTIFLKKSPLDGGDH